MTKAVRFLIVGLILAAVAATGVWVYRRGDALAFATKKPATAEEKKKLEKEEALKELDRQRRGIMVQPAPARALPFNPAPSQDVQKNIRTVEEINRINRMNAELRQQQQRQPAPPKTPQ